MLSNKDVRIEGGNLIINGEKHPIVQDVSEIETEVAALVANTAFLDFAHFVKIPYTTSILESIEAAFENGTIPIDVYAITFGVVAGNAGSQRAVFIAQNQTLGSTQIRCGAIYFGAYTAPHYCYKQDGAAWVDTAL